MFYLLFRDKDMGNFIFEENETWEYHMVLTWLLSVLLRSMKMKLELSAWFLTTTSPGPAWARWLPNYCTKWLQAINNLCHIPIFYPLLGDRGMGNFIFKENEKGSGYALQKANPLSDRKSKMDTCGGRSSAVQLEIYCHRWLRILHGCTVWEKRSLQYRLW